MESKVKAFGHAVHPMLIPFPLGLLGTAVAFDGLRVITGKPAFGQAAHLMIGAGIPSGLVAGIVGGVDWLAIPDDTRAKQVATLHGAGNLAVLAIFAWVWRQRRRRPADASPLTLGLEAVGLAGAAVTGWLGGELVERLGVGVDRKPHLNAPSSLSRE